MAQTVVITWMDGEVAAYENVTTNVITGILHVYPCTESGRVIPGAEWHFPVSNIRAYGPAPWAASRTAGTTVG